MGARDSHARAGPRPPIRTRGQTRTRTRRTRQRAVICRSAIWRPVIFHSADRRSVRGHMPIGDLAPGDR